MPRSTLLLVTLLLAACGGAGGDGQDGSLSADAAAVADGGASDGAPTGCEDEGCACTATGATLPCGTEVGACLSGRTTCDGTVWGACVGATAPTDETCNGADDNCDGVVDEGCPCTGGETRPCGDETGACELGTQTCTGGRWGDCAGDVEPSAETLDLVDQDCNGVVDDGFSVLSLFGEDYTGAGGPCPAGLTGRGAFKVDHVDYTPPNGSGLAWDGQHVYSGWLQICSGTVDAERLIRESDTCPAGFASRGVFTVDTFYVGGAGSLYDGTVVPEGTRLRLCSSSPSNGIYVASDELTGYAAECPTGTTWRGGWKPDTVTAAAPPTAIDTTGRAIRQGWLMYCGK